MIATSEQELKDQTRELWKEVRELNLIFGKIRRSCAKKQFEN